MNNKSSKIESNNANTMETNLEKLSNIKKVEASPFLLTCIQQKIANQTSEYISTKWVYAMAASVLLLLCVNIFTIVKKEKTYEVTSLAKNMHLLTNDNFYNEQ